MARLGVLGWPVAHSRSPAIHNAALDAVGLHDWRYQRLPLPPQLFAQVTPALADAGFLGANVTIPHKAAALAVSDRATAAAREIGAANTLTFAPDSSIEADNTDGPGLINALGDGVRGSSALVLGAGGSARAAVWALRRAGAREVSVWNRTHARAEQLAGELGARAVERPRPADILVNCTSVGLAAPREGVAALERSASEDRQLNQVGLTFDHVGEYSYVVDLVYRPGNTALLAAAAAHGVRTLDGLEVLVAQGALSFELWTGKAAPLQLMREAARSEDRRD